MKYDEVQVGERYALLRGGLEDEVEVVEKGEKTMRVYSGARHDFRGHDSTAKRIRIRYVAYDRDDWVLARQISRPWAAAAQQRAVEEQAKAEANARLDRVKGRLSSARWDWSSVRGDYDREHVVVSLDEIEVLLASLPQTGEAEQ